MAVITIPCNANGQTVPVQFHVGSPNAKNHPIQHQVSWMASERGVSVPSDIMDNLKELHTISEQNNLPYEELLTVALKNAFNKPDGQQSQVPEDPNKPEIL